MVKNKNICGHSYSRYHYQNSVRTSSFLYFKSNIVVTEYGFVLKPSPLINRAYATWHIVCIVMSFCAFYRDSLATYCPVIFTCSATPGIRCTGVARENPFRINHRVFFVTVGRRWELLPSMF